MEITGCCIRFQVTVDEFDEKSRRKLTSVFRDLTKLIVQLNWWWLREREGKEVGIAPRICSLVNRPHPKHTDSRVFIWQTHLRPFSQWCAFHLLTIFSIKVNSLFHNQQLCQRFCFKGDSVNSTLLFTWSSWRCLERSVANWGNRCPFKFVLLSSTWPVLIFFVALNLEIQSAS